MAGLRWADPGFVSFRLPVRQEELPAQSPIGAGRSLYLHLYQYILMDMSINPQARSRKWLALVAGLAAAASLAVQAQTLPDRVVQSRPVDLTLPVEALVEAVNQATLAAQVSGRVVEVHVDAGQAVNKGDLLMKIDAREASEVAAGASAQYVNARAHYQRMLSLRQQGFVSPAAVDKAKADLDAAQATQGRRRLASATRQCAHPCPVSSRSASPSLVKWRFPASRCCRSTNLVACGSPAASRSTGWHKCARYGRPGSSFRNWEDGSTQPPSVFCRPPMRRHMSRRCASVCRPESPGLFPACMRGRTS